MLYCYFTERRIELDHVASSQGDFYDQAVGSGVTCDIWGDVCAGGGHVAVGVTGPLFLTGGLIPVCAVQLHVENAEFNKFKI